MKIHVKLLIAIFVVMIGSNMNTKETKTANYLIYVDEIIDDFANDMKKKYNLHCYGSGGSMPTDVEKIEVLFNSYSKSADNDVRKIQVTAILELLNKINSHEKIRPFLREYPFNTDRIGISISFRTETDDYPFDGSVAYVF